MKMFLQHYFRFSNANYRYIQLSFTEDTTCSKLHEI